MDVNHSTINHYNKQAIMNDYHDIYIPEEDLEGLELGGYHDDGYDEEDDFFSDDEIRDQETGFCSSRPPKKRHGNKRR